MRFDFIEFDLEAFCKEHLLSVLTIAQVTRIPQMTLYRARDKGRIKPENYNKILRMYPKAKKFRGTKQYNTLKEIADK
jgi:hypothetical protein